MGARILTALVGLPVILGATWLGGIWLLTLTTAISTIATKELHKILTFQGGSASLVLVLLFSVIFNIHGYLEAPWTNFIVTAHVTTTLLWSLVAFRSSAFFSRWALTLSIPLYTSWLLSYALLIRGLPDGNFWLLTSLLTVIATDTTAYAIGRSIGRHPVSPAISPNKTWEGCMAGLLGGTATFFVVVALFNLPGSWMSHLLMSIVCPILAQLGDLIESAIKRASGVKDTGTLLPGHGGLLDRIDSILFVLPLLHYYVLWWIL